jgi:nicotinamide riboside kinase
MINGKKVIAISGGESTGKTTLATQLCGRLRTRGLLAELVYEPGASLPFAPTFLDKGIEGWLYQITKRISQEVAVATRPNVDVLIVDRTPIDFLAYYATRFLPTASLEDQALYEALLALGTAWVRRYDLIYSLSVTGSTYRADGFRAHESFNTWRAPADQKMWSMLKLRCPDAIRVDGQYRSRAEYVYHHIISQMLNETRPLRAYQQVRAWLEQRGWKLLSVLPQGSNSINRFHAPSDNDDIDMMVVVDGDANYAIQVKEDFEAHRVQLENIVQADLDVLITPKGLEAYEM